MAKAKKRKPNGCSKWTRMVTPLERGIAHARKRMAGLGESDRLAARYMILCNLIETMWANRKEKEYYRVDYTDLDPVTSQQAREVASFIESLYEDECAKAAQWDEIQ